MSRAINYTALTEPVTRPEIVAFKAQTRADGTSWGQTQAVQVVAAVIFGFAALLVVLMFAGLSLSFVASARARGGAPGGITGSALPIVLALALIGLGVVAVRRWLRMSNWETWMRLSRFATANNMLFSASQSRPNYPGSIFTIGTGRTTTNHLMSATDRFLDIGNYEYTTGSGKSSQTHHWGFMALNLDRKLPNIVLDSKANNGLFGATNLPATFAKNQVLSLEGDFDKYFTLYCPKQYERDALYIFTPDLMALLIDEAAPFDVELVDDWMFVYSSKPFKSLDPALYARLFRIVDTVGAKALSQSDRYSDDRVNNFAANTVAPQGKRLRRGFPLATVVIVGVMVCFWLLPRIMDIFVR